MVDSKEEFNFPQIIQSDR